MNFERYVKGVHELDELGLDFTDLYVIAKYRAAQQVHGVDGVTIMALSKNAVVSKTIMLRRIKKLVSKGVFAKVERVGDMRIRVLVDGQNMGMINESFDSV